MSTLSMACPPPLRSLPSFSAAAPLTAALSLHRPDPLPLPLPADPSSPVPVPPPKQELKRPEMLVMGSLPLSLPASQRPRFVEHLTLSHETENGSNPDSIEEFDDDEYKYLFKEPRGSSKRDHIMHSIYVGSAAALTDFDWFERQQTGNCPVVVLNCASKTEAPLELPEHLKSHVHVIQREMEDSHEPLPSMREAMSATADVIHEYHEMGYVVLVVCRRGMSRSASAVIGYLIRYQHMTLRQAVELMRLKRPVSYPNLGFWVLLMELELECCGKSTVPHEALVYHRAGREHMRR